MSLSRFRRSPQEIVFRLRQEAGNLMLFAIPPAGPAITPGPLAALPDLEPVLDALAGSSYAAEVTVIAEKLIEHRFPLLGLELQTGPSIDWRRDYVHGQTTAAVYFRRVPYLDFRAAGDHKIIWELNRHQHLVTLAQAWRWTGRSEFVHEIEAQLTSWIEQNPPQRGINWASALEVAFRALSWLWVRQIGGAKLRLALPDGLEQRWARSLYHHGCHLENNLSVYFSPNTHLLGEAVALDALGRCLPTWPRSERWRNMGTRIVAEQLDRQVLPDGAHFEQSSYYHVYALDFFLLHAILAGRDRDPYWRQRLSDMARFLHALLGAGRRIPLIGDDDGGRLFHPFGDHAAYGRATLATASIVLQSDEWPITPEDTAQQAAWWLGAHALKTVQPGRSQASGHFAGTGLTIVNTPRLHVIAEAGGFGPFRAGHSHADALQITVRLDDEDILIDPGTYVYISDPEWRDRFRSAVMHNTISSDGYPQASPANPFAWRDRPAVKLLDWQPGEQVTSWSAVCRTAGMQHRRTWRLLEDQVLFVWDEVEILSGTAATVWQNWHFASAEAEKRLLLPASAVTIREQGGEYGWRSRALGHKDPAPVIRVRQDASSCTFAAAIWLSQEQVPQLQTNLADGEIHLIAGRWQTTIGLMK